MAATTDFKSLFLALQPLLTAPASAEERFGIMMRARHGVGKSQVVYQTADAIYWDTQEQRVGYKTDDVYDADDSRFVDYTMVERRASQMSEGDLLGIPSPEGYDVNGETASRFRPFEWLVRSCTEPCVLFLDELDRASQEVRQGFFEMGDSRKLAGWHLHPGSIIFAACNGGLNGANYQVSEMDPAELDRWTVFDVEPSVEDWLTWADSRVDKVVWDFINQNRDHLEHTGDVEPSKVYPSRRSWARLNAVVTSASLLNREGAFDAGVLFTLTNGFVGTEAAIGFVDFVKAYDRQVSIEDILDAGSFDKLEEWGITEYTALVDKMESARIFTDDLSETRAQNLAELFCLHCPSEVAMKLWTALSGGSADNQKNVVKFYARTVSDGRKVSEHLVEMLGQDNQ
jgi:MoxR-like ATPase